MFQKFLTQIRDWLNKMINQKSVSDALSVDIALSSLMADALAIWSGMYIGDASWLSKEIKSLGLAASIAGEIAMSTTIEMEVDITGSARADYLAKQMENVISRLRINTEYANAKGGLVFKPYVVGDEILVDYVQADQFYPVSFDGNGNITSAIFSDQRKKGQFWYTRLEYHRFDNDQYIIINKVFKSDSENVLGNETSFSVVSDWADLEEEVVVTGITSPLFSYFKYPFANSIDTSSPLGVSCYSRAIGLIEEADKIASGLYWEFESGKRAIYVDETAFGKDASTGKAKLPIGRLYRSLKGTGPIGEKGKLFDAWTPEFREASYQSGLNGVLRSIEFSCFLSYGTISDPAEIAKTATEVNSSKQRYYSMVSDNQKSLKTALDQLLYAMDVYADLFGLAPSGEYEATYDFDDSIIVDADTQMLQDRIDVQSGLLSKVDYRVRNYGESEEFAKNKLAEIEAEREPVGFFEE